MSRKIHTNILIVINSRSEIRGTISRLSLFSIFLKIYLFIREIARERQREMERENPKQPSC